MKVLLVNTFDRDGGAARAARRLHLGLRGIGVDSRMLVQTKTGGDPHTEAAADFAHRRLEPHLPLIDALPLGFHPRRDVSHWGNAWFPTSLARRIREIDPDLIHLHWINRGLLSLADLRRWRKPIVWTLHDLWPFTGGCHYPPLGCDRFRGECGHCPALGSRHGFDLSRVNWRRKHRLWRDLDLQVLAPSHWLTDLARQSSLFHDRPCATLPNGIDTAFYAPGDRAAARAALGLPPEKPLILVVAMNAGSDANKGGHLALEAIRIAADRLGPDAAELLIAGESDGPGKARAAWPIHRMGVLTEEADMVRLYQAADLQWVPSYQENFSNALLEASSCGLPCLAFAAGGNRDIVVDGETGILARAHDPAALAEGLVRLLSSPALRAEWGAAARERVRANFGIGTIARAHRTLYAERIGP